MRTIRVLLCVTILTVGVGLAYAQEDEVPIYLARFDSELEYERYADWIADLDNIRFAIIERGLAWSPEVEAWSREYVQEPQKVESNDGIYLITYAEGGIDAESADELLQTVTRAFGKWLERRSADTHERDRERFEDELAILEDRAIKLGIVKEVDALQSELADVSARLLEARLEVAQAEARARTVMEHVEKNNTVVTDEARKAASAKRAVLEKQLSDREVRLVRAKELHERGLSPELELRQAELELMQSEADLAEHQADSVQRASNTGDRDLRRVLIDAESSRASALALEKVLREQEKELRELIGQTMDHKRQIEELERRLGWRRPTVIRRSETREPGSPDLIRPESRQNEINQKHRPR